jgi:hypothetical protein
MFRLGRSILFLFLSLAGSTNSDSAESAALQVQIYDYAELTPQTLREFLSRTERILANTGMSVQVILCRGRLAVPCENQTGSLKSLVVRILAGDSKSTKNAMRPALGHSFADHNGGIYATVFWRTVQDSAAATNVPWVVVLAHAAAHEVGHLLLGAQAHTSRGLMKANWGQDDYTAMNQGRLHFTTEQAQMLANSYGRPVEVSNAAPARQGPR